MFRVWIGSKFGFLNSGDGDAIEEEEIPELVEFAEEAVAVPLTDDGKRRRDINGARIRVDTGDEEKADEAELEVRLQMEIVLFCQLFYGDDGLTSAAARRKTLFKEWE